MAHLPETQLQRVSRSMAASTKPLPSWDTFSSPTPAEQLLNKTEEVFSTQASMRTRKQGTREWERWPLVQRLVQKEVHDEVIAGAYL